MAALYDASAELLRGREKNDIQANTVLLVDYWTTVARHMPDWAKVFKGQKLALELRQKKISSHSTVLRALGGLPPFIMSDDTWNFATGFTVPT